MRTWSIGVCLFAFIVSAEVFAVVSRFERLTIEQGLSQNTVTAILKDSQGFMWFGTREGLNRFDGVTFRTFTYKPQNSGSISDNYIWSLLEDEQGSIWVGTAGGGLNRFDRTTERFEHFMPRKGDVHSLSDIGVRSLFQDSQGQLWIGTNDGGLNRFDRTNKTFERWQYRASDDNSLSHNRVYDMTEGLPGVLWLATAGGVSRFDSRSGTFRRFRHQRDDPHSLAHDRVRAVVKDGQGRLWFGTDGGGLNRLEQDLEHFVRFQHSSRPASLSSNYVNALFADGDKGLWVGTWGGGLNRFDFATEHFSAETHDPSYRYSLSANLVYSLLQDDAGILWVGTSGGGVNKFDTRTLRFGHHRQSGDRAGGLSDNNVRALLVDSKGTLWAGTRGGGVNRQDKGAKNFSHIAAGNDSFSLSNAQIYTLFEGSDGDIWIGTAKGLNRLHRRSGQITRYRHDGKAGSISDDRVKHIIETEPGIFWIATHGGGLNRFDSHSQKFSAYTHQKGNEQSLSHNILTRLEADGQGKIWLATLGGGLNLFDQKTQRVERFMHDPDDPSSLSNDRVFTLYLDAADRLWVGTARGLNLWQPKTRQFKRYLPSDGLAGEVVLAILGDAQGHLWISGNHGLTRFDPQTGRFHRFDDKDGLQSNEFNLNAAYRAPNGHLLFGGINGYNDFDPQAILLDERLVPVQLTGFLLSNQAVAINPAGGDEGGFVLRRAINALEQLVLTDKERMVSFEFAALDYANPAKNRYAYRLKNFDEDWVYTGADRRLASYTKLDPGEYVFEVKASNKDGVWNEQGKAIAVVVLPPWYLSWQALLSYGIVGFLLLFGGYRLRTRALYRRAELLEAKVQQRTETINQLMVQKHRMFANVSHEFKTPLTLILNPLDALIKDPQTQLFSRQLSLMRRNAQRLLKMVEQLLELSKLEMRPAEQQYHYYSLADTLKALLASYQPLFDSKNLSLKYQSFDDVILHLTTDSLEMILGNLISNALKYTPNGGQVVVMVKADDKKVLIAVSDSGIGIGPQDRTLIFNRFTRANEPHQQAIPGAGIGLALVKELVEVNRGTIGLISELGKGSTFTVTLPVAQVTDAPLAQFGGAMTATMIEASSELADEPKHPVAAAEQDEGASGASVLLVDDNPEMLALLQQTLKGRFQTIAYSDGEQALAAAQAQLPDLVVSDVMMPGMSGFELLKALKSSALTDHIPVLLLTAKGDAQSRIKGWEEKADEYLDKPFNAEELLSRIDNLLAIRALLRKRYQGAIATPSMEIEPNADKTPLGVMPEAIAQEGIHSCNQQFFKRVYSLLEKHYADETLDVRFLADKLAMSQRQLGRKMKAVLDYTPTELIRVYRLNKAAELLKQGMTPSAVAFDVGFSSHSYFSQCFKAQFDCLPSSYR